MSKLTFGEERVGINFNPSQKEEVATVTSRKLVKI